MNWNSNNIYLVRITFVLPEKYRLVRITFVLPEKYRLEWGGGGGEPPTLIL